MKGILKASVGLLIFCLVGMSLSPFSCLAVGSEAGWNQSGKFGGAVALKGNHCLLGVDVGELDRMTLPMWIRPFAQKQDETSIFSCFNWEKGALHWLLERDGGLNLCINGCDPEEVHSKGRLRPNIWSHVALVSDSTGIFAAIFIDGEQDGRVSYSDAVTLELWDFCVGGWNVEPRAFNGEIDDVRIYGSPVWCKYHSRVTPSTTVT